MSVDRVLRELEEIDRVLDRAPFELYYNVYTAGIKYNNKIYDYAVYVARGIDAETFKREVSFAFKCIRGIRHHLIHSKGIRKVYLDSLNDSLTIEFSTGDVEDITALPKILLLGQNFIAIIPKTLLLIITPERTGVSYRGYWYIDSSSNLIYHDWLSKKLRVVMMRAERVELWESPLSPLSLSTNSPNTIERALNPNT